MRECSRWGTEGAVEPGRGGRPNKLPLGTDPYVMIPFLPGTQGHRPYVQHITGPTANTRQIPTPSQAPKACESICTGA